MKKKYKIFQTKYNILYIRLGHNFNIEKGG
jgi:hypothetical protein